RSLAAAEAGHVVLFALALERRIHSVLKGLGINRKLKLDHAFFELFTRNQVHWEHSSKHSSTRYYSIRISRMPYANDNCLCSFALSRRSSWGKSRCRRQIPAGSGCPPARPAPHSGWLCRADGRTSSGSRRTRAARPPARGRRRRGRSAGNAETPIF